jgi:hypothetical protein
MALADELREIAARLVRNPAFYTEGGRLQSIATRVAQVEERAERAERAAEQWEHAHDYAARELEELAAALEDARASSASSVAIPSQSAP